MGSVSAALFVATLLKLGRTSATVAARKRSAMQLECKNFSASTTPAILGRRESQATPRSQFRLQGRNRNLVGSSRLQPDC